jgi:hypothetical protein
MRRLLMVAWRAAQHHRSLPREGQPAPCLFFAGFTWTHSPLAQGLELCSRMAKHARLEPKRVEVERQQQTASNDAVRRLKTIPAVHNKIPWQIALLTQSE